MKQLTESKTIRFSEMQMKSLQILKTKGININQFIRLSIKEKIQRDWKSIKEKSLKNECPF